MKKQLYRIISIVIIISILFTGLPVMNLYAATPYDGSASSWALPEIEDAEKNDLTYPGILSVFKNNINREEFCMIVVKLYEKLSGETVIASGDPFSDTKNPEIIKAYNLGIVAGTGEGKFTPYTNITRQELAAMIYRTLDKALPGMSKDLLNNYIIADKDKISDWALEPTAFCFDRGIIVGVGGGIFDPLSNTTREQAIAIVNRTYLSYKDTSSAEDFEDPGLVIGQENPILSEKFKYENLDWDKRLAYPKFDTRLKIDTVKIGGENSKKAAAYGNFIDKDGNKKVEFTFSTTASGAAKIVWQVSRVQYSGFEEGWKNPGGLLSTGEVLPSAGKFTVDFGSAKLSERLLGFNENHVELAESSTLLAALLPVNPSISLIPKLEISTGNNFSLYKKGTGIPKEQAVYYIRAVAVDSAGNPIGDPGLGLPVIYGNPLTLDSEINNVMFLALPDFELWTTVRDGEPSIGKEFPNFFKKLDQALDINPPSTIRWFQWKELGSDAYKVILQVSTNRFSYNKTNWDTPEGLVYEKSYMLSSYKPVISFNDAASVDFGEFSPTSSLLGDKAIKYYIRAVALKLNEDVPGHADVLLSQPVEVTYKNPNPIKWYIPKTIKVPSNAVLVKKISYTPIQFEDIDWQEYYQIFRAPKWNEVNFKVKNGTTGEILYPYSLSRYNVSPQDYQDKIVPKFLSEGSELRIMPPKESQKSWYEKLWDTISNFFKSIADLTKKLVNWVSKVYSNLKTKLVNAVADLIPAGPLRNIVKSALTALVDYGLAAIGLPPSLPNFDALMQMGRSFANEGFDYAVKVALQETGIPVTDLTIEETKKLAEGVYNEAAAAKNSTPNPLDAPFLKPSPSRIYRPAYIDIDVVNPSTTNISPSGSIYISVNSGNYPGFPLFEPIAGEPLPALLPGEKISIRFFFKEYVEAHEIASTHPEGPIVLRKDFNEAYFGTGNYKDPFGHAADYRKSVYSIYIIYNMPTDAETEAKRLGLDNIPNKEDYLITYEYDTTAYTKTFTNTPKDPVTFNY